MPPRTIVLPVKCSTVKKVDEWVGTVILKIELPIICILSLVYTYLFQIGPTHGNISGADQLTTTLVVISCFGVVISVFYGAFVAAWLIDNIPHLECIKDEPEEP